MSAAMPCKTPVKCREETCRSIGKHTTKYACIADADESMRIRLEGVPQKISRRSHRCKRNKFTKSLQFGTQVYYDASSIKNTRCEGCSGEKREKLQKIPAADDKKSETRKK